MNYKVETFILARSGRFRDGLLALLNATPQVGVVHQIESDLVDFRPPVSIQRILLVLDAGMINQEDWDHLRQIQKQNTPVQYSCIVLAENTFQKQMAKMAGADGVLLVGFPAAQFFAIVEDILCQGEADMDKNNEDIVPISQQKTTRIDAINATVK